MFYIFPILHAVVYSSSRSISFMILIGRIWGSNQLLVITCFVILLLDFTVNVNSKLESRMGMATSVELLLAAFSIWK
jgi:hypothetical protein